MLAKRGDGGMILVTSPQLSAPPIREMEMRERREDKIRGNENEIGRTREQLVWL